MTQPIGGSSGSTTPQVTVAGVKVTDPTPAPYGYSVPASGPPVPITAEQDAAAAAAVAAYNAGYKKV